VQAVTTACVRPLRHTQLTLLLPFRTGAIFHANAELSGAAELLFAVYQQLDPAGPAATTAALEQVRRGYMSSCLSCLRQTAHTTAASAAAAAVAAVRALSLLEALLDDSERERGDRGLLSHAARQRGRPVKVRLQCAPALLQLPTATATTAATTGTNSAATSNEGYSASAGVCMGPANRPGTSTAAATAATSSTGSGSELLLELRSSATLWDVRCRVAAAAAEAAAAAAAQDAAGSDEDEELSQQIAAVAAADAAAAAAQPQEVVLYCGTRLLRNTDNGRTLQELGLAASSSGSGSDTTVWRAEKAAVAYSAQGEKAAYT
jgi:trimeric autotransporter adhesin